MNHRIALAISCLLLCIAVVDAIVLKMLGIWGAIDSPGKALLLGVMLLFNILALPVGVILVVLKLPTRRNRGWCPRCSYDLRFQYSDGCPECGWGREAREEA